MKYLKLYNKFVFETYGQKTNFYHVAEKENLYSLLKSIDIKRTSDRGQGSGFYVVTDLNIAEKMKINQGPSTKKNELIIEIESILDEDNFDLDYELIKELPELIKNSIAIKNFTKLKVVGKDRIFHVLVNKSDKVDESDFLVEMDELDGMGVFIPKCSKSITFGFYPDDLEEYQQAGNVSYMTYCMDTLDKLGIKSLIEKEFFKKIGTDNKNYYLRYVGPPIKPTRYKLKDEKGNWGDWIENI
jgi:hypothetical protein